MFWIIYNKIICFIWYQCNEQYAIHVHYLLLSTFNSAYVCNPLLGPIFISQYVYTLKTVFVYHLVLKYHIRCSNTPQHMTEIMFTEIKDVFRCIYLHIICILCSLPFILLQISSRMIHILWSFYIYIKIYINFLFSLIYITPISIQQKAVKRYLLLSFDPSNLYGVHR